jgi:hypothetical protein
MVPVAGVCDCGANAQSPTRRLQREHCKRDDSRLNAVRARGRGGSGEGVTDLLLVVDVEKEMDGADTVRDSTEFEREELVGSGRAVSIDQPKRDVTIDVSDGSGCGVGAGLEFSWGGSESAGSKTERVNEASARESAWICVDACPEKMRLE